MRARRPAPLTLVAALALSSALTACSGGGTAASPTNAPPAAAQPLQSDALASAAEPEADEDPTAITGILVGEAEVPTVGDPDATGRVEIPAQATGEQVCVTITVEGVAPLTAAHIHRGEAGVPGDVVVPLEAPPVDATAETCGMAEPALRDEILENPEAFYVNLHNDEFPDGAVRAQLSRPVGP